ncbi:xanthine dehydrogenase family protein subunit M [Candidatus Acetothermia bacterium]|nr:xanthine dehydrogenase family protein subunit M [Candidatus Acetothermia bacterium]
MRNFEHITPPDLESAVDLLSERGTKSIAGGTDLLPEMKSRLRSPRRLVNLKALEELRYLKHNARKGFQIGALTTLAEIESNELIREKIPILAQAASVAASPQLRNMGTIGGNLCQSVRCWYYRAPEFKCWLKGGDTCYAIEGENKFHAILESSPCCAVHPSDLAPALMALGASVHITGTDEEGTVSLEEFFVRPKASNRQMTILGANELITEVQVPMLDGDSSGIYLKAMDRKVWAFALVSVAVQVSWDKERVKGARIVLGGVAPIPWRVPAAEEIVRDQAITEEIATSASEAALEGAQPLRDNGYKIALAKALVKRALMTLAERAKK